MCGDVDKDVIIVCCYQLSGSRGTGFTLQLVWCHCPLSVLLSPAPAPVTMLLVLLQCVLVTGDGEPVEMAMCIFWHNNIR